jgi:O-acetyl-ADP-ribose deacetylase (regulator of RNase III)
MKRQIEASPCSIVDAGTDCAVNASNNTASLGSGVSRAFFEECGGKILQEEMKAKLEDEHDGVLEEGDCLVTSAGTSTKFKFALHVPAVDCSGTRARVGQAGFEHTVTSPERVRACVEAALRAVATLAEREGRPLSVAFPLLGAGAGGLTVGTVCQAMIGAMRGFFHEQPEASIAAIIFAVPEPDRLEICARLLKSAFG